MIPGNSTIPAVIIGAEYRAGGKQLFDALQRFQSISHHVRAASSCGPFHFPNGQIGDVRMPDRTVRHNQRLAFMSKNQSNKPIEIKISTVVAVSAILRATDLAALDAAMKKMTGGAPDYFDHEFAVLDIGACDPAQEGSVDWSALIELFKSYSLNPVAVRGAPAAMEQEIIASGLSIDTLAQPRLETPKPEPEPEPVIAEPATVVAPVQASLLEPEPAPAAMIVDTPVRAGQRIYARGADLIVTAVVNSGAELIADGSIHIYAPLRGRALAGASGNAQARIFALSMEAELVSIAGIYRTFENGLPKDLAKQPAQVRLAGDRIDVVSIRA
jgi:septum site-determining protein MinC